MSINTKDTVAFTYSERIAALRMTKLAQTKEKISLTGYKDHDDHALILPPEGSREIVKTMSSSGMPITDCLIKGFEIKSNHPSGGFFGPLCVSENFRSLLEVHPPYVDPYSSLAGGYMANFMSYRKPHWNPDFSIAHLEEDIQKYKLLPGIGATQHFCQDLKIGLDLGWGGILEKIHKYRVINSEPEKVEFYDALENIVLGMQNWISRTAAYARTLAETEQNPQLRENLLEMAAMNEKLVTEKPTSFREACQWILWYQDAARMYNGSGSLGKMDLLLQPFYERDMASGKLTDEEAIFHLACLLIRDTAYIQLGGPDESGKDVTSPLSFLILEAAHQLKIPANIGICVGESTDPRLLTRGVEILFEDKTGIPKFLGVDRTIEGFVKKGYSKELARQRAYSGCHWSAIPGKEYTLNDCVKINFAAIFEYAYHEMMTEPGVTPSIQELWTRFTYHLKKSVEATAKCLDHHMAYMDKVFPELVLDLLCYGPIEKGLDASHKGVEITNLCIDGAGLATVADSFAALDQRIEREKRMSWQEIYSHIQNNWEGTEGENARLMMRSIPRYGSGGSLADEYAKDIVRDFTQYVVEKPTPAGYELMPGLFSWANTIPMGKEIGATPNGRKVGDPISHGSNPDPGFRKDGAPTAMAAAIAGVQPGFGNTAPMQMELEPSISKEKGGVENIASLIRSHFLLGGTQINMNLVDAAKIMEAHKDPSKYPDLVVRVTGFSAYFASLSPEFRQLVVNRIMTEN